MTLEIGVKGSWHQRECWVWDCVAHGHGAQPKEASGSQVGPFIHYAKVSRGLCDTWSEAHCLPRVWVWEMPGRRWTHGWVDHRGWGWDEQE